MRRAICRILLAVGLASQGLVTAGDGPCTLPAADQVEPASADESWPVLRGCVEDPPLEPGVDRDFEQTWSRMLQCGVAAREIVRAGTDADREQLWSVFDELPERSHVAADVLNAFLDRHLERDLAALEGSSAPRTVDPPVVALEIPDSLRDAPAELQQAWRLYQTVVEGGQNTRDRHSGEDRIVFQSNQPTFRRTVAGLLRGEVPAMDAVRELSRYEWGGWCGTGSGMLIGPQSKALLIANLKLGRVDLALAASGGLDTPLVRPEGQTGRWDRRLLAAAGIDWEGFYLGGVLADQVDLANGLARHGSDRALRHLLAAARVVEAAEEEWSAAEPLLWPLAAVVEPSGSCLDYGTSDSREVQRAAEAAAVGGDVQEDVLELLAEKVGPDAGLDEAETASHLLVQLCRPESRPTFRAMLRSPYEEVRNRGAIGLRGLGETVADPRPSLPVAFRIVVDGKPAGQRKVEWTLRTGEGNEESSSADADVEGVVRLSRDRFLDPRRRVASVRLGAPDLASASDIWFASSLEPPANLDAVSTVSVRTGSLTVEIPRPLLAGAEGDAPTLQLIAETDRYGIETIPLPVSANLPVVSARVTFTHLQHGRYLVWLRRGDSVHTSPTIEVNERPATMIVNERSVDEELAERLPPDQ